MSTRSDVLWRVRLVSIRASAATFVPAEETWIVKNVSLVNWGATDAVVTLRAIANDGSLAIAQFVSESLPSNASVQVDCWVVMTEADELQLASNVAPVDAWISGTRLPAPP